MSPRDGEERFISQLLAIRELLTPDEREAVAQGISELRPEAIPALLDSTIELFGLSPDELRAEARLIAMAEYRWAQSMTGFRRFEKPVREGDER